MVEAVRDGRGRLANPPRNGEVPARAGGGVASGIFYGRKHGQWPLRRFAPPPRSGEDLRAAPPPKPAELRPSSHPNHVSKTNSPPLPSIPPLQNEKEPTTTLSDEILHFKGMFSRTWVIRHCERSAAIPRVRPEPSQATLDCVAPLAMTDGVAFPLSPR